MKHLSSIEDQNFRREFEACKFPPAEFNHRAHIRLAYVYLSAYDTDTAHQLMRSALISFLYYLGVDVSNHYSSSSTTMPTRRRRANSREARRTEYGRIRS